MSNDFVYDMSQINEEEIFKGWELLKNEEGQEFWVNNLDCEDGADYIPGFDDGEDVEDGYDEDFWEEQYFA